MLEFEQQCLGAGVLQTIYDWVTVAIFGALIVLFLHRSTAQEEPQDNIFQYLPACLGCAAANYVGNQGHGAVAFGIIVAVVGYIVYVLKPFNLKF
ncbi:XrtV sorting system accessory protein [Phenylobacterium sp. Root700]|uniref:XrtV sorting system accessory protein n=1 Tax=Phenylobacterium sp. Root700 TaxID=1736591 RepID=UPI00191101EA|nr:XrtV sorting system accessory protein [Phenylobacterium sp. Root700]